LFIPDSPEKAPSHAYTPSPAINNCGVLTLFLAGEGLGVRLVPTNQMQIKPYEIDMNRQLG
jgi:hypothetical protein